MRLYRHTLSDDEQDLNDSILQLTEAIFLPFHPSHRSDINPMEVFFALTEALFRRSFKFEQQSDFKSCIKYLHYFRDQSFEPFGIPYNDITKLLVNALALQLELEPGPSVKNVEEMSVLCRELLVSNVENLYLDDMFSRLAHAVCHVVSAWNQPSEQVIECLREANARLPDLHQVSIALSWSLLHRFGVTKPNNDFDEVISTLHNVLAYRSPDGSRSPRRSNATALAATIAFHRYTLYDDSEHLEEAISRVHDHLNIAPSEDPERSVFNDLLEILERRRFEEFGVSNSPRRADSRALEVVDIPSFSHLTASLAELKPNVVRSLLMTARDRNRHLDAVLSIHRITNIADVAEAIKYCRLLFASLPN